MATSIPLPALHVETPQQPNALEQYARLMQIKSAQQNQQIQQQEIQKNQMALQDQNIGRKAFLDANGDLDKTVQLAAKYGMSPQGVQQLQLHSVDVKTKTADLVSKQGANAAMQADLLAGAHDAVDKAKPEDKPAEYQRQLQGLQQRGVDVSQMPQQYPGDDQFKMIGAVVQGHKQQVEDALKASEQAKNDADAALKGAEKKKIDLETNPDNPANPDIRKQKYEGILQKVQTGGLSAVSPAELSFARSYENGQRKTTTQSDSLGVTSVNTSAPSGLAAAAGQGGRPVQSGGTATPQRGGSTSTPQGANVKESIVDAIGQYKYNPTLFNRMAAKHPDILAAVTQKYPDFSQSNYNAANKAITDLAPSGKTGQQITSYNTFLRHAGALYDAVDKLDNSKYSDLLNKPMNWLAQHTGDPRVADFMAAMQPPMKEFQSFLLNNHAMHEEDVKDAHALIDVNKTPQEIKAVLNRFAETGSARLSEQNESFKRVTGRDIPNLVSPEAAKAYNKITGQGGGNQSNVPSGATGKAKGSDGQWHYHDANGNDLGVAR